MGYAFDYRIRTAPTASGGTAMLSWFDTFRIPGLYQTAARRGGIYQVPQRDGLYQPVVEEYYDSPTLICDGLLKRSTSGSTGTGGALHIEANYSAWWAAINDPFTELWFGIDHPAHGRLERRVRPMGRPVVGDAPWRITTMFQCVDAFWRSEADSTDNGSTFTLSGDAPDGQAQILVTGTTGTFTHVASSDAITLTSAPAAGGTLFNMDTKTVTNSSDGSAFTGYTVNSPQWMRFRAGSNQITNTGGMTMSIDYYPKYF